LPPILLPMLSISLISPLDAADLLMIFISIFLMIIF